MAKGLSIKPIVPLIADTFSCMYELDTKVTAKEVQAKVRTKLKDKYKDKKLPPDWPSVSAVGKVITKIRPKFGTDPKDNPFSLGALVKYPIPPEALPTVLRAWAQYRKQGDTLTIREALWFSRLSSVLSEFEKVGDKNRNLGNLVQWYAIRERAYEATGETIDTTDPDTTVLQLLKLEEEKEEDRTLPWVHEDGVIKDAKGKIRGQLRVITASDDSKQPKVKKSKGGTK